VILAAALALVVLHRVDGGEVVVNSNQVTSLRSVPGSMSRHFPGPSKCLVGLTDGRFVAVIEPCGEVKRLLETAAPP